MDNKVLNVNELINNKKGAEAESRSNKTRSAAQFNSMRDAITSAPVGVF